MRGDGNVLGDALDEAVVYFPTDADFAIKNFKTSAEIYKIGRNLKVLWIGYSISQGYGTFFIRRKFC